MPATFSGYRSIIDAFKAKALSEHEIEKRLSDLMLLSDFSASLIEMTETPEIAEFTLLTILEYTTATKGVFWLATDSGLEILTSRGFRSSSVPEVWKPAIPVTEEPFVYRSSVSNDDAAIFETYDVRMILPIRLKNRNLAFVGIGDRTDERTESKGECETLEALAQMCAVALENARAGQALSLLNRKLSLKVFQLNTLFELSKDFYSVWDAQTIFHILGSTLIGQLVL